MNENPLNDRGAAFVARRCGHCDRTRAQALRPLLERPEMKVFSRLVLDAGTAVELLKD